MDIKKHVNRCIRDLRQLAITHRTKLPLIGAILLLLSVYLGSKLSSQPISVFHTKNEVSFDGGRILDSSSRMYERKEKILSKTVNDVLSSQNAIKQTLDQLKKELTELRDNTPKIEPQSESDQSQINLPISKEPSVTFGPPPGTYQTGTVSGGVLTPESLSQERPKKQIQNTEKGPVIISFPVKATETAAETGIILPSGSYVRSMLLTGVEAPEGKTYPVLMQLDYAFIGPNRHRVDLSGCFMIAKAQGDLSTERVQMQASKISCVSKKGRMFERDVNGFVADDTDNSFAVIGSVNSKQDRVVVMSFLSSVVEGVGKAIQQAQTSQQTNAVGGTQSMITGSQGQYIAAGGASNAASLVTQFYLKRAQSLLPTINVGSGREVWIVMQDKVELPNWFFRKTNKGEEHDFTYVSRIMD